MTDETKKDLTDIQELTQASQPSISHMAGKDVNPVMEEQKIETIDTFESFDEFQKSGLTNAPPASSEPPSDATPPMEQTATETVSEFPPMEESMASMEHAPPTDSSVAAGTPGMNTTGLDMGEGSHQDMSGIPGMGAPEATSPSDFTPPPFTPDTQSSSFSATGTESFQQPMVSQAPTSTPTPPQGTQILSGSTTESQLYPNPPSSFGDGRSATQILQAQVSGLASVKQRSENMNLMKGRTLQPFDFIMNGYLDPLNQSKFKDIVIKNNLGLTAEELEIQFKSGKIKLPKISEYAGVYLIQSFRDAAVDMRLIPVNDPDITQSSNDPRIDAYLSEPGAALTTSLADQIPITSGEILPEFRDWEIVDTLTGSIGLTSEAIEVETTDLYTSAVEALKREMRLRAFHKGASAIILFSVSMVRLSIPTHYKIFAVGTAINRIGTG